MSRDQFVRDAYQFVGVPYRYGGNDLTIGVDCSGFVNGVLRRFNLVPDLDHNCAMLYDYFTGATEENAIDCRTQYLAPGNLLFFKGRGGWHIAIYIGIVKDVETMIEAAGGTSKTATLADALNRDACVRLSNINRRKDRIAIVDPFILAE